jgi:peptide/nickel transport system substrate-binding protein/oligopeptide transport system substrate-binding protein
MEFSSLRCDQPILSVFVNPHRSLFFVFFFLCFFLQACSPKGKNEEYGGAFFMPPADKDTLVLYDMRDPPTLDPARSWAVLDGRLIGLVFSNLVRFDHEAEIQPDLASVWSISADGKQYTFHLKPQAKFSNGRPVAAEDVRYSFERILDPKSASPSRWVLERIKTIDVIDPHTLSLTLDKPFAPFLGLLAMPAASVVPREEVERCEREDIPFGEQPIGSGPWLFKEWQHDQYLDFDRNDEYWDEKPNIPHLRIRIFGSPFTAIAEFETGNSAVIDPVPEAEILRWKTHPKWNSYTALTPLLTTDMLVFNCKRVPLDQIHIRRALCQAIETALVLECVREGAGIVATGPIPVGLAGYTPDKKPFPYNPQAAKNVLASSDLRNREMRLLLPAAENFVRSIGEVVQAEWKKIGLSVRIVQVEWVTYRRMLREGDFDVAFRNWFADYPDGDNFLFPLFHSSQLDAGNFSRFQDEEVDHFIEQSQLELNEEHRTELLRQVNDLIYEKAPALFLWYRAKYIVSQPWLKQYTEPLIFNGTRFLKERIEPPDRDAIQ